LERAETVGRFSTMTGSKSKPSVENAGERPSRPEDSDTHRLKRAKRLLRKDILPEGAALAVQADDAREDSETHAALKRALDDREAEETE
jgi:hypothetical protein